MTASGLLIAAAALYGVAEGLSAANGADTSSVMGLAIGLAVAGVIGLLLAAIGAMLQR